MPIIVSSIKIPINEDIESSFKIALDNLDLTNNQIKSIKVYKKSLDARKRTDIVFVVSVIVSLNDADIEEQYVKDLNKNNIRFKEHSQLIVNYGTKKLSEPIVIVGFGPAGIFCAYLLALHGYSPIVLERGSDVDKRCNDVDNFWNNAKLNQESNVLFGEGGAGTFSDGKLTTRISDPLCQYVLEKLVEFGADEDILHTAKPHIGTDKLRENIKNIRLKIEELGGKVLFNKKLTNIHIKNQAIYSLNTNNEEIKTNNIILATGHSARDTFKMLLDKGVIIENKPFSVGVRIEHLQDTINYGLYGEFKNHKNIPVGEYQLSYREKNRCVYTFCMCPGGFVVPSSNEENSVVTNGMSLHDRDGKNANSALVVSVDEKDFGKAPLAAMYYQEEIEKKAFVLGGNNYKAPANDVKGFLNDSPSLNIKSVKPTYSIGVTSADFSKIFSKDIHDMLKKGIYKFNTQLKGFNSPDAIVTGVETRTSSPVRILRNENLQSINVKGLYPCGEGAGYAGGIISAAVDGLKIALKIISEYSPK